MKRGLRERRAALLISGLLLGCPEAPPAQPAAPPEPKPTLSEEKLDDLITFALDAEQGKHSPKEPAVTQPTAPWSLDFHDGSGNGTRLCRDEGAVPRFEYSPVTPAESSSGTYSGGEPARGALSDADAAALWALAERLASDPSIHVEGRAMGTARLVLTTPDGERAVVLRMGTFGELADRLTALRGGSK